MKVLKYISIFSCLTFMMLSCKNESKNKQKDPAENVSVKTIEGEDRTVKQSDGLTLLKGDFLFLADAAVLQTHREIYGVVIDEKMHELDDMVSKYKTADTDMVPVEIRGKISQKPQNEEGWPYRVEIKEILKVSAPDPNTSDIIKIGQ
ncbi:MAG: hypothetical protein HKO90_04265 [Flavobacteriaceae bacterium]|nr:hypothetical protein [Bacteroidia bacterium]NNK87475.1 hypothetical protein [Flavobacteriaceae bacterium]